MDDMRTEQGPCTCHQLQDPGRFGTVMYTEGCPALIPVQLADGAGCVLRPKDPLPVTGRQARKAAVSALNRFASQVGGKLPNLDTMLPRELFGERSALLHSVRGKVEELSEHMYVRIVDKGAGVLWAFCKHWLWKQTEQFLVKEHYSSCAETPDRVREATAALIFERGWNANPRARMCVLYIIGKAKSLLKGQWLWRPIAAYPEPLIRKLDLRTAARAFTCFLKHLIQEVPNSFQVCGLTMSPPGSPGWGNKIFPTSQSWTANNNSIRLNPAGLTGTCRRGLSLSVGAGGGECRRSHGACTILPLHWTDLD